METHRQLRLYDHLLGFHLFQGLSRGELMQMAGNTKFGFEKLGPDSVVVRAGDACHGLRFLISGRLNHTVASLDGSYSVTEPLSAPWLLQPEALFGASPRYTCSAATITECHFILLSKDEVMRLLDDFLIVRLNLMNMLATQSQRRGTRPWRQPEPSLRGRVVRFMTDRCAYPAGPKTFRIKMERMAAEVNDSRLKVSQVLNAMQRQQLLSLHRGRIEVAALERLLM